MGKEYLWQQNTLNQLPFNFVDCGRWWGNNPLLKQEQEIDIIAYNKEEKKAIFSECKWTNKPVDLRVLNHLVKKSGMFDFEDKYYMLFSKNGFADDVWEKAKENSKILLVDFDMM
jgi:AAA+ ATPase superfamily predicted ATPase